tara:strand:- start:324 stop:707 length:384 start_codon:yes stop_codon:yes gene_type:complete
VIAFLTAALIVGASPICDEAESIAAGDKALCSGVLVPSHEALQCVTCVQVDLPECAAKFRYLHSECQINLSALESAVEAERYRGDNLQAALVEGLRSPPWYERPAYVFIGGALLGTLGTLTALYYLE